MWWWHTPSVAGEEEPCVVHTSSVPGGERPSLVVAHALSTSTSEAVDLCGFEANLVYIMSSRPSRATQ